MVNVLHTAHVEVSAAVATEAIKKASWYGVDFLIVAESKERTVESDCVEMSLAD